MRICQLPGCKFSCQFSLTCILECGTLTWACLSWFHPSITSKFENAFFLIEKLRFWQIFDKIANYLGPIFCQGVNIDTFEVAGLTFTGKYPWMKFYSTIRYFSFLPLPLSLSSLARPPPTPLSFCVNFWEWVYLEYFFCMENSFWWG